MRTGIKVGDVLSEASHYIVTGLNFDGSIICHEHGFKIKLVLSNSFYFM